MGITSILLSLLSWQVIVVTIVTGIIYYYLKCIKQMADYPPGPFPLPLIGNLHLLTGNDESIQAKITKLSKHYGPLMTLWLGRKPMVVASDGETAKVILITKGRAFAGRHEHTSVKLFTTGKGIGSADYGDEWKRNRRMVHTSIQVEGGKFQYLHDLVMDDIQAVTDKLIALNGKPFNPRHKIHFLFVSIVCKLMFNITVKEESEEYKKLCSISDNIREGLRKSLFQIVMSRMPFAKKNSSEPFKKFYSVINDLTEAYIKQQKLRKESGNVQPNMSLAKILEDENKVDASFTVEHWPAIFGDLYVAASDSSYNITSWILLYMVTFPKKQQALQEHIDENWGNETDPLYLQKDKFPYVDAVWHET